FFDGHASLELRVPFSHGLSSDLNLRAGSVVGTADGGLAVAPTPDNSLGSEGTQWGDLTLILKSLLYTNCNKTLVFSGGLAVELPTGDDTSVHITDFAGPTTSPVPTIQRDRDIHIANDTVGISPFVAFLAQPNDRFFAQGFVQVDIPLNKNTVTFSE